VTTSLLSFDLQALSRCLQLESHQCVEIECFLNYNTIKMANADPSYIDYETFLSPDFSASSFANSLVLSTNNASDTALDLSTPLSRVLFDLQEVDTHIHTLTTKSALPLLTHTKTQNESSQRILSALSVQIASLTQSYGRLEAEVINRHAVAEEVRLAASRLWVTIKIGRAVSRALSLGRQLEAQMLELQPSLGTATGRKDESHRTMLAATTTILTLRALLAADGPGEEGEHLRRIHAIDTLRRDLEAPSEARLRGKAQQIVREFSLSSVASQAAPSTDPRSTARSPPATSSGIAAPPAPTYAQTAETKSRTASAACTLYLLSSIPSRPPESADDFVPNLLLNALQSYLQAALTSSAATLRIALAQLNTLPGALREVSARCRNVAALEMLLLATEAPYHPLMSATAPSHAHHQKKTNGTTDASSGTINGSDAQDAEEAQAEASSSRANLLTPLLASLDTSSLPSFFWRTLASGLSPKVSDIVSKGGLAARNLRAQRDRVRESVREAVLRGCEGASRPEGRRLGEELPLERVWDREVGVMVGSVLGPLGR